MMFPKLPPTNRRYWLEFSRDANDDLVRDEQGRRKIEDRIQSWLKGERPVLILPPGVTLHHVDHPVFNEEPGSKEAPFFLPADATVLR